MYDRQDGLQEKRDDIKHGYDTSRKACPEDVANPDKPIEFDIKIGPNASDCSRIDAVVYAVFRIAVPLATVAIGSCQIPSFCEEEGEAPHRHEQCQATVLAKAIAVKGYEQGTIANARQKPSQTEPALAKPQNTEQGRAIKEPTIHSSDAGRGSLQLSGYALFNNGIRLQVRKWVPLSTFEAADGRLSVDL
ncbi:hypothetical protein CNMCM5793_009617 [Aspergillus hiratsukae]|uniref:Uncharacterized protein n=1 Tax=Aspergillus hiratsukae TaxID=1194566 RepID=A0A8H6QA91_9EURO|nr:hypothetical protein CNMCM5793_009617 [Aspergillus hiratsukae]KAF7168694.1 hypothetical protein CNMCM6106_003812 [Aspergillus hiratsukae]